MLSNRGREIPFEHYLHPVQCYASLGGLVVNLDFLLDIHFRPQGSFNHWFLSDPGVPGVQSMGPDVRHSVPPTPSLDLTDVTLADEDTNSILTDNANRAIQCKLYNLVANFRTNASDVT